MKPSQCKRSSQIFRGKKKEVTLKLCPACMSPSSAPVHVRRRRRPDDSAPAVHRREAGQDESAGHGVKDVSHLQCLEATLREHVRFKRQCAQGHRLVRMCSTT